MNDTKYKLIVLDVDGTLVNNKKQITDNTIDAINKAFSNNVLVTIASGRPLSGLSEYLKYFKDVPFITFNGASIKTKNGNVIFEKHIDVMISNLIINYCLKSDYCINNNLNIIVWNNNKLYVNVINDDILFYEKTSGMRAEVFSDSNFTEVNKIIIYGQNEYLLQVKKELESINKNINCEFSSDNYLEFYDKSVSKGKAVEILGKCLNINKNEIIAIGDNYNDLSMIKYAGLGIAMGNSPQEIKDESDYVTYSNEEDGVCKAIEKFILK